MAQLVTWKDDPQRKPLVLDGARQTGKTWIAREFGRTHFKRVAYVSLQDDPAMQELFAGSLRPERLISGIALAAGTRIDPADTLIVLDEVQEVPHAVESLKYFAEEAPQYPIIATGSTLGITIHRNVSFPVGKVDVLRLYPFSFREFLNACGQDQLTQILESGDTDLMTVFHERFMEYLKYYMVVGGMPEAVQAFIDTYPGVDFERITRIQTAIEHGYRSDFSKYPDDMPQGFALRLTQLWDSLPQQLARETKKFTYSAIKPGARGREYDLAIQRLQDSSLVTQVPRARTVEYPLPMFVDRSAFKLFTMDTGLLREMSGIEPQTILEGDKVFRTAKGALAEQLVCQELVAAGFEPYYWTDTNAAHELDFLVQIDGRVMPIEVKAGGNLKSTSLKYAMRKFGITSAVRFSSLPPRHDGAIIDLPLYAVSTLKSRPLQPQKQ
ncbi:hypothetical protein GA0061078_1684 [Bifidobacterium bohemicum]|uniref:ATPase n=2 Tax=Bifidobacterium bohemicum TaxID=638617 RepID=A0A086ZH94_9BIFI|nr:ATPase [Bifidobacterium bohemicum DSM 22767]SCC16527.1 hypothetical protein GA0061078_1684 [Bifidobacterium bohemicum]